MQKLPALFMVLALALSSPATAAQCGSPSSSRFADLLRERTSSTVAIIIQTPMGEPAYGSGVVWDGDGHIVTNDHVVAAGSVYTVVVSGAPPRPARLVARAPGNDLAVLRVDGPVPSPAPKAAVRHLRAGDPVFAIGNPFGRGLSAASGVVSRFDQEVITGPTTHLTGMLQTTVPLNPGNSGGPLFDCDGRLVGVNTAVVQQAGTGESLGFSIPVERASQVVAALLAGSTSVASAELPAPSPASSPVAPPAASGVTPRPGLGLYVAPGPAGLLVVERVVPGSPADRAGARAGDAIVQANGRAISSAGELQSIVRDGVLGSIAVLRIVRSGWTLDMAVQIRPLSFTS